VSRPVRFPAGSEPRRIEWFLAGTEPDAATPAPAAGRARIVAPVGGTVIALDPDIPGDLQRVVLEATGPTAGARFTVDGQPVGPGGGLVVWPPVPGRHVVALLDADDREVDRVRIEVRGPGSSRASRK
jgi:penicillin-binding protein 1C